MPELQLLHSLPINPYLCLHIIVGEESRASDLPLGLPDVAHFARSRRQVFKRPFNWHFASSPLINAIIAQLIGFEFEALEDFRGLTNVERLANT